MHRYTIGLLVLAIITGVVGLAHKIFFDYLDLGFWSFSNIHLYWFLPSLGIAALLSEKWESAESRLLSRAPRWVNTAFWAVVLVAVFQYMRPPTPFNFFDYTEKFTVGTDQSWYRLMIVRMLNGTFEKEAFFYGLGFPLLGRAIYQFFPFDPLLVLSYACAAMTVTSIGITVHKLTGQRLTALVTVLFMAHSDYLIMETRDVWTSNLSLALVASSLAALTAIGTRSISLLWLGFATGLIFMARYVDILLLGPLWVALAYMQIRRPDIVSRKAFLAGSATIAIFLAVVAWAHNKYFGSIWITPYSLHERPGGASDQDLATLLINAGLPMFIHLFGSMIDPSATAHDWGVTGSPAQMAPVLARNFFFFCGFIGIPMFWRHLRNALGLPVSIAFAVGLALYAVIYAMHPGSYPGCLIFGSHHYFQVFSPFLIVAGVCLVTNLVAGRDRYRFRTAAISAGSVMIVIPLFSQFGWAIKPKNVLIDLNHQRVAVGDSIEFKVSFTNSRGKAAAGSLIRTFAPDVKWLFDEPSGQVQERKIGGVTATPLPTGELVWKGALTATADMVSARNTRIKAAWSSGTPFTVRPRTQP